MKCKKRTYLGFDHESLIQFPTMITDTQSIIVANKQWLNVFSIINRLNLFEIVSKFADRTIRIYHRSKDKHSLIKKQTHKEIIWTQNTLKHEGLNLNKIIHKKLY